METCIYDFTWQWLSPIVLASKSFTWAINLGKSPKTSVKCLVLIFSCLYHFSLRVFLFISPLLCAALAILTLKAGGSAGERYLRVGK